MIGRVRKAADDLPAYRPGKSTIEQERVDDTLEVVKLSSNENPMPPIAPVIAAITEAMNHVNRYPDHRAEALRSAIASWLSVTPEQVTVGAGSVGLLQQLMLTYVDPGDEVIFPWRSFEAYPIFARLMGGIAVTPPLVDHAFDLEAVAAAVTPRTKLILLASPNNPTGTALTTSAVDRLVSSVPNDVVIVVDEAYKEFMSPDLGDSVNDLLPSHNNVVVLRTFSKTHGLAGLRAGYAIGHPEVIEALDKTLLPFAVNAIAQAACLGAISGMDEIRTQVAGIVAERERVAGRLTAMGYSLPRSEANFVYIPTADKTDAVFKSLQTHGIITRPFENEGVRVTIGTPEENDRFLEAMQTADLDPGVRRDP